MKHIGALIGLIVVVFGTTFLFTSDLATTILGERATQATAPAQPRVAPRLDQTAQAPSQDQQIASSPQAQTRLEHEQDTAEAEGTALDAPETDVAAEAETAIAPESADAPAAPGADVDIEALLALGANEYMATCAGCHGAEGRDGFGPAFAGNANLADTDHVLDAVLHGFGAMPSFSFLDDEPIAAIVSHIRNSWGNDFGPILPEDVAEAR